MLSTKKILLMVGIAIAYFLFDTLLQAGFFTSIENQHGISTELINGIWGTEDMEWDRKNNLLYISSTHRRSATNGDWKNTDGIYRLDMNKEGTKPVQMETNWNGDFHPHGISLFERNGNQYLYVVNHTANSESVELFQIENQSLTHLESYIDDLMFSPNDVVGDEIGKFYVSNDHGNRSKTGVIVENYLRMPYSYVLYFDGNSFKKVDQGLVYANGLQLTNSGDQLVISHTIGHEVFILDRNKESGDLKLQKTINLGTGVDNIDIDSEGNIWVAGHPKLLQFTNHKKTPENISASQVFKIELQDGKYTSKKVFEDDGKLISGSSVAVHSNGTLFIGCVFDETIVKVKI